MSILDAPRKASAYANPTDLAIISTKDLDAVALHGAAADEVPERTEPRDLPAQRHLLIAAVLEELGLRLLAHRSRGEQRGAVWRHPLAQVGVSLSLLNRTLSLQSYFVRV